MAAITIQSDSNPCFSIGAGVIDAQNEIMGVQAVARPHEDSVSLVFREVIVTPRLKELLLRECPRLSGTQKQLVHWAYNSCEPLFAVNFQNIGGSVNPCPGIDKLLINLHLRPIPKSDGEFLPQMFLISAVARVCKKFFPQINPTESAFNVTIGFQSYRADSNLLPSAKTEQIDLFPR